MKAAVHVTLVLAATLGLLAWLVHDLGDRLIFVPPPEAVTEGFVRELVTERYTSAVPYLSRSAAERIGVEQLRIATKRLLDEAGTIFDVTGERVRVEGDRAEARARLATERTGTKSLVFRLVWQNDGWKIDGGDGL